MAPGETDGEFPIGPTTAAALQLAVDRAQETAFFFDFDGTLAPIEDDPEGVQPVPGMVLTLAALSRRVARVAIISARPVEFLRSRFADVPDVALFGVYGLEALRDNQPIEIEPAVLPYLDVMRELSLRARAELPRRVLVEDKRLSIALHYRTAPDLRDTVERWGTARAAELDLWAQEGRMVLELKPPVHRDKGQVVLEETEGLSSAWYFGDDISDREAFSALDRRGELDPDFAGVRVAVANPETGAGLAAAADLTLASPEELRDFLRALNARLQVP